MTMRRLAACLPWVAALGGLAAFAAPRASGDAPRSEPPAPPPAVAGPAEAQRAKVKAIVDELRAEAAEIRGLPWKQDVPADLLSRAELKVKLEELLKEDFKADEYERDLKILRRMGMLGPTEDPLEIMKRFYEQGVAGLYDPRRKRLYVVDGLTGDGQRPTILHELIHALEDQHFDLEKLKTAVEDDSDRSFALSCVIEGSAEAARRIYERRNPAIARISRAEQMKSQDTLAFAKSTATTPAFLTVPSLMHYQTGPALVQRYVDGDYPGGMARLHAGDFPASQEACLHPRKFVTEHRDLPRKITWSESVARAAGEGYEGLKASGYGQLDFVMWIDYWLGATRGKIDVKLMESGRYWTDRAGAAAEGWDGMTMQVVEKDGKPTLVLIASAWDSPTDASEAAQAILEVLRKQHGAGWKLGSVGSTPSEHGVTETTSFTSPFGAGRVVVRGDLVWVIDGAPADRLDAVWTALEAIPIERDPKDTWAPGNERDPLAGSTWQALGVGWKAPDGFAAPAEGPPGAFVKGGLRVHAIAIPMPPQTAVGLLLRTIVNGYPNSTFDPDNLKDTVVAVAVGDKEGERIDFDDRTSAGLVTHQFFFVPVSGSVSLVIHAEGPKAGWSQAERDLVGALAAFRFAD